MVGAFFFILFEFVLLLDMACNWVAAWREKMSDVPIYGIGLIFFTFLFYGGSIALTVILYVYFTASGSDCQLNKFLISFNLVICVVFTCVSMLARVQEAVLGAGIFQSGLMTIFSTYLTWSALTNTNQGNCQPTNNDASRTTTIAVGFVFGLVAVLYGSARTGHATQLGKLGMTEESPLQPSKDDGARGQTVVDDETDAVHYNWSYFHVSLMLASLYMMMVITNWANPGGSNTNPFLAGDSQASVWFQIVGAWVSGLLYLWTLTAPLLFPNRTWS